MYPGERTDGPYRVTVS